MIEKERHWTFILYPESAPTNWKDILQDTGLPIAISPLHNKDINSTGESKKEHYHVLVSFPGPTTFNKVNSICAKLNCPIPKRVLSCVGIIRYFTHKDNPDKAQYDERDIFVLNGFDLDNYNQLTTSQILVIKKSLINIIRNNNFVEYSDLCNWLIDNDFLDMFNVVSTNTIFFNNYITSCRHKLNSDL